MGRWYGVRVGLRRTYVRGFRGELTVKKRKGTRNVRFPNTPENSYNDPPNTSCDDLLFPTHRGHGPGPPHG
jgi:hypothetical protein